MSLILIEGFDDLIATSKGWTLYTAFPANNVQLATGRFGSGCNNMAGGSSGNYSRTSRIVSAADEHARMIAGWARKQDQVVGTNASAGSVGMGGFMSDNGTVVHICVNTSPSGIVDIRLGGPGGTILASSLNQVVFAGEWAYYELKVHLHDTTGLAELKVNGVLVASYTGDTKNGGTKTVLDTFAWSNASAGNTYTDDVYLCNGAGTTYNDCLGDCRVQTLLPNGNGARSEFLGSDGNSVDNYLLVDEAGVPVQTDFVSSSTPGAGDTYAYADLTAVGNVLGVQVTAFGKTDAGTGNIATLARSDGVDAVGPTKEFTTTAMAAVGLYTTAPNGGSWTQAKVSAAEFGATVVT